MNILDEIEEMDFEAMTEPEKSVWLFRAYKYCMGETIEKMRSDISTLKYKGADE